MIKDNYLLPCEAKRSHRMNNYDSCGEISPSQELAGNILVTAIVVWSILLAAWLYQGVGFFREWYGADIPIVIGAVFIGLSIINGSSMSPISHWFNHALDRDGGWPWVSIISSVVMTTAIIISFVQFPSSWVFLPIVGGCSLIGVPFCSNIMSRFD